MRKIIKTAVVMVLIAALLGGNMAAYADAGSAIRSPVNHLNAAYWEGFTAENVDNCIKVSWPAHKDAAYYTVCCQPMDVVYSILSAEYSSDFSTVVYENSYIDKSILKHGGRYKYWIDAYNEDGKLLYFVNTPIITYEGYKFTDVTQEKALEWVNDQVGRVIDYDNDGKSICSDLTKAYNAFLFGNQEFCASKRLEYYDESNNIIGRRTPFVANENNWKVVYSDPQPGDVAVWNDGSTFSKKLEEQGYVINGGHVEVVIGIDGNRLVSVRNVPNGCYIDNTHEIDYVDFFMRPIFKHDHTLEYIPPQEATPDQPGNIDHWRCSYCDRCFADENGNTEFEKGDVTVQYQVNFPDVNSYTDGQFRDVNSSDWFSDNVATAYELGLMRGISGTAFGSSGNVTVAETVTMAARIHSIFTTGSENFVQGETWYKAYLDYALNNGIITKEIYDSDVTRNATRAEFAIIFANALPDYALGKINDILPDSIPAVLSSEIWTRYISGNKDIVSTGYEIYNPGNLPLGEAVYKLYNAGIIRGINEYGEFSPSTTISRVEAAAIVSRMANSSQRLRFDLNYFPLNLSLHR